MIKQRRSPPPPKLTPLSLFPAFPFSSPKHFNTICFFVGLIALFFFFWSGLLWSGYQSFSNCEAFTLERLCGASLVHAN
ncbi:hypothetical protein N7516_003702 [Penicillium verrucosum]|uniref:uncharacterized protein n=1 Tax=Penicillium verrucosum TaxID=60171 RepID=UPI0025452937|nr:uncharacterized protein N7516_003702 [Penicillium verrucosum]KAJ5943534.1 hypothetical protein N7516_003702 [Penicillium verrucosum]